MKLCFTKNLAAIGCVTAITCSGLAQTASPLANLPLFFEANHGQTASTAPFLARTADAQCAVSASGVEMNLRRSSGHASRLQMNFVGANPAAAIRGDAGLPGKVNYLLGNDPAKWQAGVPTFAKIRVEKIYPGVDVVFYGNQQQLEYDFNFAAGANPNVVALHFGGAEKVQLNEQGELVISIGGGEIRQPRPVIYQTVNGTRQPVCGGYEIASAQTVGFKVGAYDHSLPLVIDPVLSYSTYFGGNAGETALAVAVDAGGFVYVAGKTFSSAVTNKIPWSTAGAYQTNYHGGNLIGDAFVAKFDNQGSNLVYMTYLGGKSDDGAQGVAVDDQGNAYVSGFTSSPDFPTANLPPGSGLSTNISGVAVPQLGVYPTDGFVTKLNADGTQLLYSGYLGGSEADAILGIAVDPSSGTAFVTGFTCSTNFPFTPNAYGKKLTCPYSRYYNANAFVTEIAPNGTRLNYSTYLGGTNYDVGRAIAFNNGSVFVAGRTISTNFPTTNFIPGYRFLNGSTNANNFDQDAFVAAFSMASETNLTLLYSTLLGGTNSDVANGIAADAAGNAYVVGSTTSTNFPYLNALASFGTNSSSYVRTNLTGYPATNAFLTQIQWNGTNAVIGYSAMFGGKGNDVATAVALDAATGNAYVTGYASSTNFPVVTNNLVGFSRTTNSGDSDAFVTVFTADASALLYATYLGGRSGDFGYAIAVDPAGAAYVVGQTLSTNFPTQGARQTYRNGTNDSFLTKISLDAAPTMTLEPMKNGLNGRTPEAGSPTLQLAWRMFPPTYELECSTNFNRADSWVSAPWPAAYNNGWFNVAVPATNASQFFRLRKD